MSRRGKKKAQSHKRASNRINLVPGGIRATAIATSTQDKALEQPNTNKGVGFASNAPAPLGGGRQTQPTNPNPLGLLTYSFLPRRQWQAIDLADLTSGPYALSAQQLLELLADLSPDMSQAVWNWLRLINSGYSFSVVTKNGKEVKKGQAAIEELLSQINKDYGGIKAVINSWALTAVVQGAIAGEIALTEDLEGIDDIYAVQPWTIYFVRDADQKLVPFQQQTLTASSTKSYSGNATGQGAHTVQTQVNYPADSDAFPYRRLNPVTFGYLPIDSPPDDPYGRPPAAPVLQLVGFQLQLLKDIKQAVHTNAWGRLHVQLSEEKLLAFAPPAISQDPTGQEAVKYVNARLAAFRDAYGRIKPDDAFFSTDALDLKAIDFKGGTLEIDAVVRLLERQLFRALKQLPVLMGSNEGTTETHGTVQMEIYAAGIRSLQQTIASLLEKLLTVALQVMGIPGRVKWEFDPVRAIDALKEIQAEQAKSNLAAYQRDQGWISQDTASIMATGSEAVNKDGPIYREQRFGNAPGQGQGQSEPPKKEDGGKEKDNPDDNQDEDEAK